MKPNIFDVYAPQTTILEERTNSWERLFEVLYNEVITRFGRHPFEKSFEEFAPNCSFGRPKSSFGEHKVDVIDAVYQ